MSSGCPPSMFYPMASSRLPWNPSPKRNQFRQRTGSSVGSHGSSSAYGYQTPSYQHIKKKASNGHCDPQHCEPHMSPPSSSLLERIELPSEERSLLDRMDLNGLEGVSASPDSFQGWNTRICGSQKQTISSPDSPSKQNGSSESVGC